MIWRVLGWMIRLIRSSATLAWLLVAGLVYLVAGGLAALLVLAVAVMLTVWCLVQRERAQWPTWVRWTPAWDYALHREIKPGAQLLLDMGLAKDEPGGFIGICSFDRPRMPYEPVTLVFDAPSARVTLDDVQKAADRACPHMSAVEAVASQPELHQFRIEWHRTAIPDPLADLEHMTAPLPWNGDFRAVPYGTKRDGQVATFKIENVSGTVVGGLPGGGKTAGLATLLAPLCESNAVQFVVIDGKGGHDWSWIEERASVFIREDEDREKVATQLETLLDLMRYRVANMPRLRGGASIWTTGGPTEELPLIVVIIDECQSFLDATMIPKTDKDGLAQRQRTEASTATLVRKARTAGIWVIPATQKPTSDSLPTTIGSNTASQICFAVKTPEAEKAVMGSAPGPDDPSATDLPAMPGYAVVGTESGSREVVRFRHIPEKYLFDLAHATAHNRRELDLPKTYDESSNGPSLSESEAIPPAPTEQ